MYQPPKIIQSYSVNDLLATDVVLCTGSIAPIDPTGTGDITFIIS